MVKLIKNILFTIRLRRAIKRANVMRNITGNRFYVLLHKGKPKVYAKTDLKKSIKNHRFIKGFNVATLDKIALYKTL